MQTRPIDQVLARPFLARLLTHVKLAEEERQSVLGVMGPAKVIPAHTDVLAEGHPSEGATVVLAGFACRFKQLRNGRRQILSYLVPGDVCEYRFMTAGRLDHGVATLSPALLSTLPSASLATICERFPRITRGLLRAAAVDDATTREWLINLGQRTALQRMAHIFCELHQRLEDVQLTRLGGYDLPLTQAELGGALGLSTVHVNRTLQELRRAGLIEFKNGRVTISNLEGLREAAAFNGNYLDGQAALSA
ncbi:Crp/Fnr family transcriptional regulator [Arsenicitalea aurantiaca]|uniref:Crp/Fnr family transcriptional regulator n=1 Tax=Arsenicitalea aurantiaca TaxID=1783274 RepID=A0A433X8L4_9HYPH|nr:Crp/Fnr family transcriptional regulator [Arsenicitalea aurantiaca]RUT30378.1 Crp/Fnr family transcriptional regulator [Arsenicitalea aurantiaca]